MSSRSDAADAASSDGPPGPVCDRCGDPIREDRVFRLSSEPCPALAGRYEAVTKTYCPDCVAGIGMLALSAGPRGSVIIESE
ncbi:hypothetical protein [Natrarchaeobius chitinivorans]|uniref:Uncharacterized protein n=1 Tax=Natrarchaeobius chitinivorans TaxID=1679083 RepID=A0A3N6LN24_NATCH|nr:hypothetical protein [Natrarchaeobius chitinivorans]RQG90668.1 hypothetical protein EA473_20385 [Natrarchaeobius chitinivorans]